MRTIRLALAQINLTVGDIGGNTARILDQLECARARNADLVLFPEMTIAGYPPEDLLFKLDFIDGCAQALQDIQRATSGLTAVVGYPSADDYDLYNAAAVLQDGKMIGGYRKHYLPNYGVFDESRYFGAGKESPVFDFGGDRVGVSICEDLWYAGGPPQWQALHGAELLVNISASPYSLGKGIGRERMIATRAVDNVSIVAYCNLVGGQDELMFDGRSLVYGPDGELLARGPVFEEALILVDVDLDEVFRSRLRDPRSRQDRALVTRLTEAGERIPRISGRKLCQSSAPDRTRLEPAIFAVPDHVGEIYQALVVGTRDYVRKNGFETVLLGLSGGIDSALTAAIATDALGPEHVVGVSMPSHYSSDHSKDDARQLAENMGIRFLTVPIEQPFNAMLDATERPPRSAICRYAIRRSRRKHPGPTAGYDPDGPVE